MDDFGRNEGARATIGLSPVEGRNVAALLNPRPALVVGVCHGGEINFTTIAWVTPISYEPAMVALAIRESSYSFELLERADCFSINALDAPLIEEAQICGNNSGRSVRKAALVPHFIDAHQGREGRGDDASVTQDIPVLESALSVLDCEVESISATGDHMLVCAYVTRAYSNCDSDEHGRIVASDTLLCLQHDIFALANLDLL